MRWPFSKKIEQKAEQFETVLQRLVALQEGSGGSVTPKTCMKSPTVQAIVTAISRRISSTPVHVFQTSIKDGREAKKKLPDHSVARLLRRPNAWQTSVDYFGDLASTLVRWGRYIAIKGQGSSGPIRTLFPVVPGDIEIKQDPDNLSVIFKNNTQQWPPNKVHYIRGPALDFVVGDSPVENVKTAIGIEIACEEFGASFFNNGAMPLIMFGYKDGFSGFKTPEDEKGFIEKFQAALSGSKRHRAMLVPHGIEHTVAKIENDKAQFLETRKFYQTVIAGAWGVPPHLVGNLENGHYNNVEQQDKDFTLNVVMPYIRMIETAMERDLLTDDDRRKGIVIRFNMDSVLRASFEERQAGLQTQFQNGVINQDEWRELEGKNPKPDDTGKDYYYSANLIKEGEEPMSRQEPMDADSDTPPE